HKAEQQEKARLRASKWVFQAVLPPEVYTKGLEIGYWQSRYGRMTGMMTRMKSIIVTMIKSHLSCHFNPPLHLQTMDRVPCMHLHLNLCPHLRLRVCLHLHP